MDKVNPKYKNKKLYLDVKEEINKKYKKQSAYKSMAIQKLYIQKGGTITGDNKKKLSTWRNEKWKNLSGINNLKDAKPCGQKNVNQKKSDKSICRPTKKINSKTPKLAQDYTKTQLLKAQKMKNLGLRINWSKL